MPARPTCPALLLVAVLLSLGFATSACSRQATFVELDSPAAPGARLPRLTRDESGTLWLSWVEPAGTGHALRFSALHDGGWSPARTVAAGDDWFVNWADFPSVVHLGEGRMAAHWLRQLEGGPFAYELLMSVSTDAGEHWSAPVPPHGDGTATEHGFATLFAVEDGVGAVWLDGRHTGGGGHDHGQGGHEHGHGPMTLRAGGIDWSGVPQPETELDGRVCDCCPTAAAATAHGLTVVYRGRTTEEIRDIQAVTWDWNGWSQPVSVSADGWMMPACPVNGPALAAHGERLAAAWFTAAQDRPRVLAAFSDDSGRRWSAAVEVAAGATQGRVAVVMPDADSAVVSWLEMTGDGAAIRYRRVHGRGSAGTVRTLAATSPARSSGFPQMALADGRLVFAWTVASDPPAVNTALVPLP